MPRTGRHGCDPGGIGHNAWVRRAAVLVVLLLACRDRGAPAGARPAEVRQPAAAAAIPAFEGRIDLARWIRGGSAEVGCWLERHLAHRDPRWNCAGAPAAARDPCDGAWRAGPQVPDAVARRVHPLLRHVTLAWEHGALQSATFAFDPDVPPAAMPTILGLGPGTADAVAWHGAGRCDTPCYEVLVFAPGEPDCDDGDDDEDAKGESPPD